MSVASTDQLGELQRQCRKGYVEPALIQYAVRLAAATRQPDKYLTYGASPRASIHLIECARALAFLRGRDYALPEDVVDLEPPESPPDQAVAPHATRLRRAFTCGLDLSRKGTTAPRSLPDAPEPGLRIWGPAR